MRWAGGWIIVLGLFVAGASGEERPRLALDAQGHTARVSRALFTPDSREVISVSEDKTVRFWDVASGEPLRTLRLPFREIDEGRLYAAAISPDGEWLAVGGYGPAGDWGTVYLVSLSRLQVARLLKGHGDSVVELAFSPDGRRLISGSIDTTARVWRVADGVCEFVIRGHTNAVYGVAFSPDSRRCATGSFDGTAAIWSVPTDVANPQSPRDAQRLVVLRGHRDQVASIAWRPDGKVLATGSRDHTIRLWSPEGQAYQGFDPFEDCEITSVTFTPDSRRLLFTGRPTNVPFVVAGLLDLATRKPLVKFDRHANTVQRGSLSRDGQWAVTCDAAGEIYVWQTSTGRVVQRLAGRGRVLWSAAWSPDGNAIAWGTTNAGETLVPTTPLERAFDLSQLEFSQAPLDSFLRARLERGGLRLQSSGSTSVNVLHGSRKVTLQLENDYDRANNLFRCCTLLPGERVAIGSAFGLYLFDARTGQQLGRFHGHSSEVWAISPSPNGRYLLSASGDMTLRIWDPNALRTRTPREVLTQEYVDAMQRLPEFASLLDRGDGIERLAGEIQKRGGTVNPVYVKLLQGPLTEPLLSLFFAGDDWIAWTPEGYYAASPGGERLMGWQVNHGPDKLATFHSAAQFRSTFHRPDVIQRLFQRGNLERALAEAGQRKVDIEQVLPPQVAITAPVSGHRAPRHRIDVRATAHSTGRHPVTALRLLLDGRPYQGASGVQSFAAPQLGEVRGEWRVELDPGKHKLKVLADSAVSQGASEEVEVVYIGGRDSDDSVVLPKLYVAAFGINDYAGDLRLNYAAPDAQALAAALQKYSQPLFREIEVRIATDRKATRASILKGLGWLRSQMTQNDYGIFFFAGHREIDNDGSVYFLPVDVDRDDLLSTAIGDDQFKRALSGISGKLMTLLDACHSGAVAGSTTGKRRGSSSLTDDLVRDLVTDENGVVAMCSSTGREFSLENNEYRQGNFTLALVEGLSGKADFNQDGVVYLNELDTYVTDRVKELTQGQQHPVTAKPGSVRSFPLSKP